MGQIKNIKLHIVTDIKYKMVVLSHLICTRHTLAGARFLGRIFNQSPTKYTSCSPTTTITHNNNNNNNNNNNISTTNLQCNNIHTTPQYQESSEQNIGTEEHIVDPPPPCTLPILPRRFNLTFEQYVEMKRSLHKKMRRGGTLCGLGVGSATAYHLVSLYPQYFQLDATPEKIPLLFGMDPIMVCAGGVFATAAIGYGVGSVCRKQLWRLMNRGKWNDMNARDADFLQRLDAHRYDGESKYEDNFYGENIRNLRDYKQWVWQNQMKTKNRALYSNPSDTPS